MIYAFVTILIKLYYNSLGLILYFYKDTAVHDY